MVAPTGEGAARCMRQALATVDGSIDYINAHGTSTPVGDVAELKAIREVFADQCPSIGSTKSLSGHSLGAAGVQEAIYCMLMMQNDFTAVSANIQTLDEQAEGMPVLVKGKDSGPTTVLSNSFGFGGTNASLVLRKWQD
jgi:3-oxoacyl-[acyl-carrier-protein] synthase-1